MKSILFVLAGFFFVTIATPLFSEEGETADLMRRFQLGPVVRPDDTEQIAEGLLEAMKPTHDARWAEACRAFDGRRLTGDLASCLDGLATRT